MTPEQQAYLEQQIAVLQADNARLAAELERIRLDSERAAAVRGAVLRGGARIVIPLLDRESVVRSFATLAETTSAFAGPTDGWPQREKILQDARAFVESCVRFTIRRRLFLLLFSLLATAIPVIQVYLVIQQNQIIENQNEFFRIQVYDVVARSMTEGDRNARLMTGALLANADPAFLGDVVAETFDPELAGVWRGEGAAASVRRLEDAAFRGYLAHAVVRSVQRQLAQGGDASDLAPPTAAMIARVIEDAADRVPQVLALGGEGGRTDDALDEQVDNYLAQIGAVLVVYGRLARSTGDSEAFTRDVGTLLQRVIPLRVNGNRFELAYRVALESFLIDSGMGAKLEDPPSHAPAEDEARAAARTRGVDALRATLGGQPVDWDALGLQGTPK